MDFTVIEHTNIQRYNRDTLFIDRLSVLAEVTFLYTLARQWRDIGIEKRGIPPFTFLVFEWCPVAEKSTSGIYAGRTVP